MKAVNVLEAVCIWAMADTAMEAMAPLETWPGSVIAMEATTVAVDEEAVVALKHLESSIPRRHAFCGSTQESANALIP
jgi:uncharacterized membrane protein YhhN